MPPYNTLVERRLPPPGGSEEIRWSEHLMRWIAQLFRRRTRLRYGTSLADFIDQNAAFLVQKGIYEYARARAGHYAKVLFREEDFQRAVEQSRWRAYPLGLAMVGEAVEGVISEHAHSPTAVQQAVFALVLSVFDRYPTPAALGEAAWAESRVELDRRLHLIATHARKSAQDIHEPFVQRYFDCMPIHPKLRGSDFPTIRNYLRITHVQHPRRTDQAHRPRQRVARPAQRQRLMPTALAPCAAFRFALGDSLHSCLQFPARKLHTKSCLLLPQAAPEQPRPLHGARHTQQDRRADVEPPPAIERCRDRWRR